MLKIVEKSKKLRSLVFPSDYLKNFGQVRSRNCLAQLKS